MTLKSEAEALLDEFIAVRRHLHQIPELGNEEYETSDYIQKYLTSINIPSTRVLTTGVIGTIQGKKNGINRTIALRSDIDALPVEEKTGLTYASTHPGKMHACGHDMHMASLLFAAKLLKMHEDDFSGTVKLIFQMDEEGEGGAERLIQEGVLDDVDAVYGLHVNPALPAGVIGIRYGRFYASAGKFDITVHGKGTHGAEPENGIDALYGAAVLAEKLKELTGEYDFEGEKVRAVVSVGSFHAGTVRNIIPDTAELSGIVRTPGVDFREVMKQKIEEVIQLTEEKTAVNIDMNFVNGYPGVVNHDRETALAEKCAGEILGEDSVVILNEPTMTTEDFGYYLLKRPGCFYHVGVDCEYPLHSPYFNPDERGILSAALMHASIVLKENGGETL